MITTIYLIRHADSTYSTDEVNRPISENGRLDAEKLHNQFVEMPIDKVYSSPYKRSLQTVELIAGSRRLGIEIVDALKERSKTEGKLENFHENVAKLWHDESFSFTGGESNIEGRCRGVGALEQIIDENMGESIVVATHGDLMTLIMNNYNKAYDYGFWRQLDMPDAYKLTFDGHCLKEIEKVWQR